MAALAYAPTPHETADVSKLERAAAQFMALRAETDRLMNLELELQDRAVAAYPELPVEIRDPDRPGLMKSRPTLAYLDRTEGTALVASAEQWTEATTAVHARLGLPQVQAAWKTAMTAQEAVAARVAEMTPASVRDAALKHGVLLAAHLTEEGDVMDPDVFRHAMKRFQLDLEQLASTIDT